MYGKYVCIACMYVYTKKIDISCICMGMFTCMLHSSKSLPSHNFIAFNFFQEFTVFFGLFSGSVYLFFSVSMENECLYE